jgi:hypothetical protein
VLGERRVVDQQENAGAQDQRFFAVSRLGFSLAYQAWGRILGADFLVAVGEICAFSSADRLAAYVGLVPAADDSGKRVSNHRRM